MRDDAADRGSHFGGTGRVFLQPDDFAAHPFVERGAKLGAVRTHLVDFVVDDRQHTPRDRGAERPTDQSAALFADALLDGGAQSVLPPGQQCADLRQDEAEDLLVAAALDQTVEGAGDDPAGAGTAQDARQQPARQPTGTTVLHRGQHARQRSGQRDRQRMRGSRVGEETMQNSGHIEAPEDARHLVCADHMGRDETAQGAAQAPLLPRNDGGVRNRQPERMAEQRRDREPVGYAADQPGLGSRLEQAPRPRVRPVPARHQRGAEQHQRRHQHQQQGRRAAVQREGAPGFGVGIAGGRDHAGLILIADDIDSPRPPQRRVGSVMIDAGRYYIDRRCRISQPAALRLPGLEANVIR